MNIIFMLLSIWIGISIVAWFMAERMMFPHPPASYSDGQSILRLPMEDGSTIAALYLPNGRARHTLLFAHGNGEDLGHTLPFLQILNRVGFEILAVEYPGYGTSEGSPTEKSVNAAMAAAYTFLVDDMSTRPEDIIAYGRSIGCGPAVELAANHKLGGLVLETPFVSAYRIMTHYPLLPGDRFVNIRKMPGIECPLLVIHGTDDEIIPLWHAKKIFNAANNPKTYFWVDGARHNDLVYSAGETYWDAIGSFVQSL